MRTMRALSNLRRCCQPGLPGPSRMLSTAPQRPPAERPSAETVKRLAQEAKLQEKMWNVFIPERGIHFGDKRFWMLLGIVSVLHAINTYRDAHRVPPDAIDLPDGAARRLGDGRMLMTDGSIAKGAPAGPTTLHHVKEKGENELVLDRAWRKIKEAA